MVEIPPVTQAAPGLMLPEQLAVTEDHAGLMSPAQLASLEDLTSSRPLIPVTTVNLTDTVTKDLIVIDWSQIPDGSSAFTLNYSVECTDGTNVQIQSGLLNANLARASNGTYASNTTAAATSNTVTSGGMTITFSWNTTSSPSFPTLRVNANSSLTPTILRITFYVGFATHPLAVSVAS